MSDLRGQVIRLNHAAQSSLQYGAIAEDLQNFPGMMNLAAGSGITLTPTTGVLTISTVSGGTSGTVAGSSIATISADTTWYSTGASVSLDAGTYLLSASIHGLMTFTAGTGTIVGKLYNSTDAADVANSELTVLSSNVAGAYQANASTSLIATIAGTKTLDLQVQRVAGGTYSSTSSRNNTAGRTVLTYVRLL